MREGRCDGEKRPSPSDDALDDVADNTDRGDCTDDRGDEARTETDIFSYVLGVASM